MDKNILNGMKFGFGFILTFALFLGIVYAGTHLASQVVPGTFLGNFIFQGNTTFNGSVGIGTTNPEALFHISKLVPNLINGSVLGSYPIAKFKVEDDNGDGKRGLEIGGPTGGVSSPVYLKVDGTSARLAILNQYNNESFTILENGNVGIGTSNPELKLSIVENVSGTFGASVRNLHDQGRSTIVLWGNESGTSGVVRRLELASVNPNYPGTGMFLNKSQVISWNMPLAIGTHTTTGSGYNISFYTDSSEKMRITDSGNVGIGTTDPQANLHIVGGMKLSQLASPPVTCDTNNEFYIYADSTGALCVCTPKAGPSWNWEIMNGYGSCS